MKPAVSNPPRKRDTLPGPRGVGELQRQAGCGKADEADDHAGVKGALQASKADEFAVGAYVSFPA